MNLSSYLARTAMANTEALGRTEIAKQRLQNELAQKQEEAQGQAIGGLTGAVLGAGVGAYQKYKADQASADAMQGFESRQNFDNRVNEAEAAGKKDLATTLATPSSAPAPKGDLARPASMKVADGSITPSRGFQDAVARDAAWRREAADTTQILPRRNPRTGAEVSNDPVVDWEALTNSDAQRLVRNSWFDLRNIMRSRR